MNYNQQTPPPYYGGGNDYNSYHNTQSQAVQTASSVMKRVYSKMTLGLLVTAFISLFCPVDPYVFFGVCQYLLLCLLELCIMV